tara:strand:+ start:69 stop:512 length:444 start_codon:yes stop_codon:yes gene_type:complete
MNHPNKEIMMRAIEIAKKNMKFESVVASIIVKGDEIISEGFTTIKRDKNPINHGEINAITNAAKKLDSHNLEGCWLYTTFEPCPMCASACVWAQIEGVVYGASMDDKNEIFNQRVLIRCEEVFNKGTPKLQLHKDFMRNECKGLLLN